MSSTLESEVASNIRAEMARRDVSQQAIADLLGITTTQVKRRLRGEVSWRLVELASIAESFGMDVRDLLPARVA